MNNLQFILEYFYKILSKFQVFCIWIFIGEYIEISYSYA
jgi:hypothetical protein